MSGSEEYDDVFYAAQARQSGGSAAAVVPLIYKLIRPDSVLDVGCGVGAWLAEWERLGVSDIHGMDGPHVDRANLLIDPSKFTAADLEQPFQLGRRFGLVQCLEVAEHLDESAAGALVGCLGEHGDTVLFSAAIPWQRGTHHVNEQWPSYWAAKFASAGFRVFDAVRPLIWSDNRVQAWYRQNMLIFSRVQEFDVPPAPLNLVHPELWRLRQELSLRQTMRRLPVAAMDAARKRLPAATH